MNNTMLHIIQFCIRINTSKDTPLIVEPFSDMDNDEHWFSQWQISNSCETFDVPIIDKYESHENWYPKRNSRW